MDCDLLRKKLAAGEATISALRGEVSEHKQEVSDVKRQLKKAEAAAHEQQQKAAEEVRRLPTGVLCIGVVPYVAARWRSVAQHGCKSAGLGCCIAVASSESFDCFLPQMHLTSVLLDELRLAGG